MRSTEGKYYPALDHLRALAAFMVFSWHFLLTGNHHLSGPPLPPLSLLSEGHTGVGLFMTLSGYLFTKLLDGRSIDYLPFIGNRIIRLLPLLIVVVLLVGIEHAVTGSMPIHDYALSVAKGVVAPSLPNGGWSITVEFHFYLLLPLLLLVDRSRLPLLILTMVIIRTIYWHQTGSVHGVSYWTLVGRIDQFVLGMLGWRSRHWLAGHAGRILTMVAVFLVGFYWFDYLGGYASNPSYPSPHPVWILLPTLEGIGYIAIIVWYDHRKAGYSGMVSRFVARIGTWSYSIYLLHFFVVHRLANWFDRQWPDLSNIYISMLCAPFAFLLVLPLAAFSYHFIEAPFLKLRRRYLQQEPADRR